MKIRTSSKRRIEDFFEMSSKSIKDITGIQVDLHPNGSYTVYLGCKDTTQGSIDYHPTIFFARSHSSTLILFNLKESVYQFTKDDKSFKFCEYEHGSNVIWNWTIPPAGEREDPVYAYQLATTGGISMAFGGFPIFPIGFGK